MHPTMNAIWSYLEYLEVELEFLVATASFSNWEFQLTRLPVTHFAGTSSH